MNEHTRDDFLIHSKNKSRKKFKANCRRITSKLALEEKKQQRKDCNDGY